MSTTRERAYTIDADPPNTCHPLHFTNLTDLPAVYGTVITMGGMEHMRVPEGWIDAMGCWCTDKEMQEALMRYPSASRVVYNPQEISN